MGAISIVLDPSLGGVDLGRLETMSPCAAVFVEPSDTIDLRELADIPTVFVIGPGDGGSVTHELVHGGYLYPRHRLIIAGETARDPSRADRLLRSIRPSEPIESFLGGD
jgi:hypothetical protein